LGLRKDMGKDLGKKKRGDDLNLVMSHQKIDWEKVNWPIFGIRKEKKLLQGRKIKKMLGNGKEKRGQYQEKLSRLGWGIRGIGDCKGIKKEKKRGSWVHSKKSVPGREG